MLRRFENFKVGALDAKRLNEMQDAIVELQRKVDRTPRFDMTRYGPFLARITQRVDISRPDCVPLSERSARIDAAIYYFEEVLLRIDGTGAQPSSIDVCVSTRHGEGMMTSAGVAGSADDVGLVPVLVDLGATEFKYDVGNVVPCFRARVDNDPQGGGMSKWREVYVTQSGIDPELAVYSVVQVLASIGQYEVVRLMSQDEKREDITNLYELSGHYGAFDPPQNPCVALEARRLRIGDTILGYRFGGALYSVAPTAFGTQCVPCTPTSGLSALAEDREGIELAAAGIVMRG